MQTATTALQPVESVAADQAAEVALELGDFADSYGVRVAVQSLTVETDAGGPILRTAIRVEAAEADGAVPSIWIACANTTEQGGWQAESTISLGDAVLMGSFAEGVLNLLIPGDGRYGEPVPACNAPAFVQMDAEGDPISWAIDDATLAALNEAAVAFNATL